MNRPGDDFTRTITYPLETHVADDRWESTSNRLDGWNLVRGTMAALPSSPPCVPLEAYGGAGQSILGVVDAADDAMTHALAMLANGPCSIQESLF